MVGSILLSTGKIINSYGDSLIDFYSKCKKKLSKDKASIPFEKQNWTALKITMLCNVLSPKDLYLYLIEIRFIINDHSSKCPKCGDQFTVVCRNNTII